MEKKRKKKTDRPSRETGSGFTPGDCQAMFEKMRSFCGDKSRLFDCCALMERVMENESGISKAEHETDHQPGNSNQMKGSV
jgi:hypothetical protein